jgi:hypothetical protein
VVVRLAKGRTAGTCMSRHGCLSHHADDERGEGGEQGDHGPPVDLLGPARSLGPVEALLQSRLRLLGGHLDEDLLFEDLLDCLLGDLRHPVDDLLALLVPGHAQLSAVYQSGEFSLDRVAFEAVEVGDASFVRYVFSVTYVRNARPADGRRVLRKVVA